MRKLFPFFFFLSALCFGQPIFKGLQFGMTPKQAKTEFKKNKKEYINIYIGNGFYYRIYHQNFQYSITNNGLVGVQLGPKGTLFGMDYSNTVAYLLQTKMFFDDLNYEIFLKPDWWDAPENFHSSQSEYGMIMFDQEKFKIVQFYPVKYFNGSSISYTVNLHIYNYDWWMNDYSKSQDNNRALQKKQGF
tara:strand:+ start:1495 stop:2061 length:567 start_codon:yes stop_codon:yes gene_type:complete